MYQIYYYFQPVRYWGEKLATKGLENINIYCTIHAVSLTSLAIKYTMGHHNTSSSKNLQLIHVLFGKFEILWLSIWLAKKIRVNKNLEIFMVSNISNLIHLHHIFSIYFSAVFSHGYTMVYM